MTSRQMTTWLVCLAALGTYTLSSGQQRATPAGSAERFEAASVRPNRSGDLLIAIDLPAPDRFTATNIPLRNLIRFAYDVPEERLLGGPDWIRFERFDVIAKADHDFHLSWTPERIAQGTRPPGAPILPPVDPSGASIFTALQEQLGLELESQQAPLDVIVIDRVDRPTAD